MHGDSHSCKIYKPLPKQELINRLSGKHPRTPLTQISSVATHRSDAKLSTIIHDRALFLCASLVPQDRAILRNLPCVRCFIDPCLNKFTDQFLFAHGFELFQTGGRCGSLPRRIVFWGSTFCGKVMGIPIQPHIISGSINAYDIFFAGFIPAQLAGIYSSANV